MARLAFSTLAILFGLAAALIWQGGSAPAEAADACPAAPQSMSTFSAAVSALNKKAVTPSGPAKPNWISGSVWAALNGKQQQEVAQELIKELNGKRVEIATSRAGKEAAKRLEELNRRIMVRDRLERDDIIRGQRDYDRSPGGRAVPYSRDPKPLSQIIDEETAKVEPGVGAKLGAKYKAAMLNAVINDPKSFSEAAGALSAGDYATVMDKAADWGAAGFSVVVGDVLEEMGYADSKLVWEAAVKRSGSAANVMRALARGDHNAAWDEIKKQWKEEVKTKGKEIGKNVINWAVSSTGEVPTAFGMTPGDAYLKLVEAEIALIQWGDNYIRMKSSLSDGECIRRYNAAYEQFGGNTDVAYDKFHECLATSRLSSMFEFGNQARSIGINEGAAQREYLEAQRRGLRNSSTPIEWIKAKVAAKQKQLQAKMVPELTRMEKVMANVATAAGKAADNRFTELAVAKMNERQWDELEKKIRAIQEALDKVLASVDDDLARIRKNSDATQEACQAYNAQRDIARSALAEGTNLSVTSSRLFDRLNEIDPSVCAAAATPPPGGENRARIKALSGEAAALEGTIAADLDKVCAAAEDIKAASDKAAARQRLDEALAAARAVEAAAAKIDAAADELKGLTGDGQPVSQALEDKRQQLLDQLAALAGEIDALDGQFVNLRDNRFNPAYEAMSQARLRVTRLVPVTSDMNKQVRGCLRVLADAPVAERPRKLLAELEDRYGGDEVCREDIDQSWRERDLDPSDGSGNVRSSAPWRLRKLELSYPPARLRAKLAELKGQCPAAEAATGEAAQPDAEIDSDALKQKARAALERMNNCVSAAITAYNDTWLKEPVAVGATCDPGENDAKLAELRGAAQGGDQDAQAQLDAFEKVAARVRAAHGAYDEAKASFAAGDAAAVRGKLNEAKSTIEALGGNPPCPELSGKIASGLDKVDRLEEILERARGAVAACDAGALRKVRALIGGSSHAELKKLAGQAGLILSAFDKYEAAKASYAGGNLGSAESELRQARSHLDSAGGGVCGDLASRISSGLDKIDRLRDAIAGADRAVAACDLDAMANSKNQLASVSNPAAAEAVRRIDGARADCEKLEGDREVAAANEQCTQSFGPLSVADRASVGSGNLQCTCSKGNIWNDDKTRCVKGPTEEEIAAANNADCKSRYGSGYYAGGARKDGTFYCLPTRSAANGVCRDKYGSNYVAGKIKSNGAFNCNLSGSAQRQAALDNCRRQYGSRFVRLVRRNGQYLCEYNNGQPRHDPNTSAAQVIQGVIGAINNSRNSGGGGGGGRPSNCHHRPGTSQQHCGSESSARPAKPRQPPPVCRKHDGRTSKVFLNMTDPRCR